MDTASLARGIDMNIRQIRIQGDIAYVPLTKGYEAVIDAADVPLVQGNNWSATVRKRTCYAFRTERTKGGQQRNILMHRIIAKAQDGMEVDHIDHDGLNNTRGNLRVCTRRQNLRNGVLRKVNSSGYKGVHKRKDRNKWQAQIRSDSGNKRLVYFDTPEEAYAAYCGASERLHKEYGCTG